MKAQESCSSSCEDALLPEYLSPGTVYKNVLPFLLGLLGNNRWRYEGEAVQSVCGQVRN